MGRRWLHDRRGNLATMTALLSPVLIVAAAFAVDSGSIYLERRHAQGLTDLAAMTAARHIADAEALALSTFAENGYTDVAAGADIHLGDSAPRWQMAVTKGLYSPDPALPHAERFQAGGSQPNAVKVELVRPASRFFSASLIAEPRIVTSAIASATPEAAFSIGSRLARLEGGILNALLGEVLGATVDLKLMDYQALAATNVELLAFLDAAALELGVEAVNYSEVLDAEISLPQIARAAAATPGAGLDARAALSRLAQQTSGARRIRLSDLIDLGDAARLTIGEVATGLEARIGALAFVNAAAQLAGGDNQVSVALAPDVPGLLSADLTLVIGERPQHSGLFRVGPAGTLVRTEQTRLRLDLRLGNTNPLFGAEIHVPLFVDLAFGEAKLASVSCASGPGSIRATIDGRPGIAQLHIADVDPRQMQDFSRTPPLPAADLVNVHVNLFLTRIAIARISAKAHVQSANLAPTTLRFTADDIAQVRAQTVGTTEALSSLTRSLIDDVQLGIHPLGLPSLIPSNVLSPLKPLLAPVATTLDVVLNNVLATLGISLGEADIRVHAASCGRVALVQ